MNKSTYIVIETRTTDSVIVLTERKNSVELDIDTLKSHNVFNLSLEQLKCLKLAIDEFLKPAQQGYEEDSLPF